MERPRFVEFSKLRCLAVLLSLCVLFMNCRDKDEETATKGFLVVSSAETAFPYAERCAVAFTTTYQKAYIDVRTYTAREALVALANGESRVAVLSRDLNEVEKDDMRKIAEQKDMTFLSPTVAYDAITVIVHGDNPVEQITFRQLEAIFTGKITNWKELGGEDRPILPLIRNRNSGTYEFFQDRVLGKQQYGATAYPCSTMAELTRYVENEPGAIGCAGMMSIQFGNLKAIAVAEKDEGPFVVPDQQSIFEKTYPLRHPVVLCYFRNESMSLVKGFVTYMLEAKGQQLAVRQGIVPATMPVRLVELK